MKKLLITLLILFCSSQAFAAIAYVQSTSADTSGTSTTLQFVTQNCTLGSTLVVGLRVGSAISTPTISDDTNGTWPAADVIKSDSFSNTLYIFHFSNSQAINKATITITLSGASSSLRFGIYEFTGLANSLALDRTASATGSGTAIATGNTSPTNQANELFFGIGENATSGDTYTVGSNIAWILKETPPSNGTGKYAGEYFIANSTQAVNAQFTLGTSDTWTGAVATFKSTNAANGNMFEVF